MTAASKMIFVDKLFVPKLNEQAEDRIHRIGADLTKPVQIYQLIARKTVEQRIEAILKKKTRTFNAVVEESDWKRQLLQAMLETNDDE
jgi:SNF2 family DNA or RNA helicase